MKTCADNVWHWRCAQPRCILWVAIKTIQVSVLNALFQNVRMVIFISNQRYGWMHVHVLGVQVQCWEFHTLYAIAALRLMQLSTIVQILVRVMMEVFTFSKHVLCGATQFVPNAHLPHIKVYY
jgi:hypothetical protein